MKRISLQGINGSAFKLLARAKKKLEEPDQSLFLAKIGTGCLQTVLRTPTEETPKQCYQRVLGAVVEHFFVVQE